METLSRNSLRVLHVEDDPDYAALGKRMLHHAGFEQPVVHCKDGVEALRYFSNLAPEQTPHVVLLDLNLPHLNGLEVLYWIRRGHAHDIPVYLLTSSNDPADRNKAALGRVTGYLLKSVVFDEVISILDQQIAVINGTASNRPQTDQTVLEEPFALTGEDANFSDQDSRSGL